MRDTVAGDTAAGTHTIYTQNEIDEGKSSALSNAHGPKYVTLLPDITARTPRLACHTDPPVNRGASVCAEEKKSHDPHPSVLTGKFRRSPRRRRSRESDNWVMSK